MRFRVQACFKAAMEGWRCAVLLLLLLLLFTVDCEQSELDAQSTATRPAALASQRFQSSS